MAAKPNQKTAEPVKGDVKPTFELNREAQEVFERLCGLMEKMGTLSPSYADLITTTASAIGRMILAEQDLNERGHISHSERGEVKNQSFTVYSSSLSLAQKGLGMLGLTPSTLGKMVVPTKVEENPFAMFNRKKP